MTKAHILPINLSKDNYPFQNGAEIPITPQASLPPAFPVVFDNSCPPSPRSSTPAWTTKDLPKTVFSPKSVTRWSSISYLATPSSPAVTFPRSPTCLSSLSGAPWVLLNGLKCGPAVLHPSVRFPNWWIWNPCSPGVSPVISAVILHFYPSVSTSLTNPLTPEPPSGFMIQIP